MPLGFCKNSLISPTHHFKRNPSKAKRPLGEGASALLKDGGGSGEMRRRSREAGRWCESRRFRFSGRTRGFERREGTRGRMRGFANHRCLSTQPPAFPPRVQGDFDQLTIWSFPCWSACYNFISSEVPVLSTISTK